jgi:2'-5' RNA ligase
MLTTSHFIGVRIRSEILADILVNLQDILGHDSSIVEFQNILSAHVTLHYLPADLGPDIAEIRREIEGCNGRPEGSLTDFGYFGSEEAPSVCYLKPGDQDWFVRASGHFAREFPQYGDVPENRLRYVPHLTIFRVRDIPAFMRKKSETESALRSVLDTIRDEDAFA